MKKSQKAVVKRVATPATTKRIAKKDTKQKVKHSNWTTRLSQLATEQRIETESNKAPLKHFERMQDSLTSITKELIVSKMKPTKADENRKRVLSARGRSLALQKEVRNFQMVLRHPAFRQDPLNAIHTHLQNTLNK